MKGDEFVFAIPGIEDYFLSFEDLAYYDDIIRAEFDRIDLNLRRNYVIIFENNQRGKDENPRPTYLGKMYIPDVLKKFG